MYSFSCPIKLSFMQNFKGVGQPEVLYMFTFKTYSVLPVDLEP